MHRDRTPPSELLAGNPRAAAGGGPLPPWPFLTASLILVAVGGCADGTLSPSSDGLRVPAVCDDPELPAGCGTACSADAQCAPGLHCADGACQAVCVEASSRSTCPAGQVCTARGRCLDDRPALDAGPPPGGGDDDCAQVTLQLDPQVPTVVLIVDRSTSMTFEFRNTDQERWEALDDALFAEAAPGQSREAGVVPAFEDRVRFGMHLYTGEGVFTRDYVCPALRSVGASAGNSDALATLFRNNRPVEDSNTPTAQAVDAVVDQTRPSPDGPTLFVLATDGFPDRCEAPATRDERARRLSVAAVQRAYEAGFETFVLSLADFGQKHVQDLANAGQGLPVLNRYEDDDPLAPPYAPGDTAGLRADLASIIGEALSCEVALDGRIDRSRACEGEVRLDGEPIACDAPGSGWRVLDEGRIELLGEACADLKAGRVRLLEARFPCTVILR